jgi:hypothetical protein
MGNAFLQQPAKLFAGECKPQSVDHHSSSRRLIANAPLECTDEAQAQMSLVSKKMSRGTTRVRKFCDRERQPESRELRRQMMLGRFRIQPFAALDERAVIVSRRPVNASTRSFDARQDLESLSRPDSRPNPPPRLERLRNETTVINLKG